MPSILIYGASQNDREKTLITMCKDLGIETFEHIDVVEITPEDNKKSIGIEQIRISNKFLSEKPINYKYKLVIIKKADLLTVQAQNSLLKTLEEPPEYAWLFLLSKSENSLLDTVISRCKKIQAKKLDHENENTFTSIVSILNQGFGDRLSIALKLAEEEKEDLIKNMDSWIEELRNQMNLKNAENIEEIVRIKKSLEETNVTTKLALENLMLRLKG